MQHSWRGLRLVRMMEFGVELHQHWRERSRMSVDGVGEREKLMGERLRTAGRMS